MIISLEVLIFFYLALFVVLAYWRPRTALALLLVFLSTYLIRFTIFGVPTTLLEVTIWAVFASWAVRQISVYGWPRLPSPRQALSERNPFSPYLYPTLLFLAVATIAAIYSPNLEAALGQWKAYFIEPLMVFVMVVLSFRGHRDRWWPVISLGVSMAVVAVVAWLQGFGLVSIPEPYGSAVVIKATSFFAYPNAVGLLVAPILAMYITWFFYDLERGKNSGLFWKIISIGLGVGAIIFSLTKGAWVGAALGLLVGLVIIVGRRRLVVVSLSLLVLLTIVFYGALNPAVLEEVTLRSTSGQMRLAVWEETADFLGDNPVAGAGLAGYQAAIRPYHVDWRPNITPYKIETFLYPHNVFLNFWSELGLAGLLVFVWLIFAFYKLAWRQRLLPMSVMAMASMTALLAHGMVDVPYFKNDLSILFWIIMALPLLESRQIHRLRLHPLSFKLMAGGMKVVEARLNDRKRQTLKIGDIILCFERGGGYGCLRLEVIDLLVRPSFTRLLEDIHFQDFGAESRDYFIERMRHIYSMEEEKEYGVVGIRVRTID